ncbi:MAG: ABC transporter ATP-binding protein [Pirellulaceae bacterium]|nr:ABC transporter ATP-binding protein [Pirellulaceae bacterium]
MTKLYGTVIGVNDVTLTLEPGAHGLLGPNGAGKTTFLNLITGQLKPTLGSIRMFGGDPWNNTNMLRRIGVSPGDEAMYSNVSGLEWVRFLVELQGFKRKDAEHRAVWALEKLDMAAAMQRPIGSYSRGMRQRTKLAQAIAHEPEFLILDEPFNGLDPVGRHVVTELLRDWTRRGGSLLLASHILHEVEAISPSFLLIYGGRLLASGTADEVNALLADVPNRIQIDCNRPRELARRLLDEDVVEAIELDGAERLTVATRHPLAIYNRLPQWAAEDGVTIGELHSTDESLQNLFDSLLRVHRGG